MKKFPKLSGNEVALVRADPGTGKVLDEEFNLAISANQNIYTIFDSVEEALEYVKSIMRETPNVEFGIYDKSQQILYDIRPT
jgi:hypothetical protein